MSRHAATRGHRFLPGLLAVAALTSATLSVTTYMAAADATGGGAQCETLSASPTPSPLPSTPTPSTSAATLCVSVQPSKTSVARGQVARFTVQVQALNGAVPDVSVTLAASGGSVTFTGYCPSGDGTATCQLGSMDTDVTPSSFTLSAGIRTPSSGAAWVSLTATAGAASTSAQATGVVTVTAGPASAASGGASTAPPRSAAAPVVTVTVTAGPTDPVGTPVAAPSPTAAAASTSAVPAENVGSVFPVITPTSSPAVTPNGSLSTSPAPAATQPAHSSGGSSTLAIAGAWVCGLLALVLAGFLAFTRRRR